MRWATLEYQDGVATPGLFDAVFFKDSTGASSYTLTLQLRVYMDWYHAFPPFYLDGNNRSFMVRAWTGPEKARFINDAMAQVKMWNNKFWLKVPATFDALNYVSIVDGRTYQPQYIKCELDVDFTARKEAAHQSLTVVNLERTVLSGSPNSGTFRSASLTWDSLDATPRITNLRDQTGAPYPMQHHTIAHEIRAQVGAGSHRRPAETAAMRHCSLRSKNWASAAGPLNRAAEIRAFATATLHPRITAPTSWAAAICSPSKTPGRGPLRRGR